MKVRCVMVGRKWRSWMVVGVDEGKRRRGLSEKSRGLKSIASLSVGDGEPSVTREQTAGRITGETMTR